MKVILTENVSTLGNVGEMVNVSNGYARNFLFPRSLAVLADESNKRQLEDSKRRLAKKIEAAKKVATDTKKKIDPITVELIKRVGPNGKLFGSVTSVDLAKELSDRGIVIERRMIAIENPIKKIGEFSVKVKLFTEVDANFKVKVLMDPKQVEEEKAKQALLAKKAKEKKTEDKMVEENAKHSDDLETLNENATEEEIKAFEKNQ